ncbi:methyltransferase [Massilia sp. YIM B04103]|uniref:methyltransferase n=1 Tax=Massilia sp. YIM B04103 TaxID=2963106 RepID=UPI00210B6623|nr:methyltransferase [Massilia sp. YIM B04103]
MPEFHSRDPLSPAFWDERFEQDFTPWDKGGAPERLRRFIAEWPAAAAGLARPAAPTVLIPGCGSAYELNLMCEAGWDATAIDFSPAAVVAAQQVAGPWRERVQEADFFAYAPPKPLDVIYERAFLCAMPRAMWPRLVQRWADLLAPGAVLAGCFFYDSHPKGPPFGTSREELHGLLAPCFDCTQEEPVGDSIAVFAGKEYWLEWRRR